MKLRPTGPRVAALVSVLLLACGLVTAASAGAAVLSGTVSGQSPGGEAKPLPETNVTVTAPDKEELVGTATADAKGNYSLEVSDGVFDVRFDPPSGYEPTTIHKVEVNGSRTLSVVLTNTSLVHLTGTLRDAAGNPVPGAGIIANSSLGNGTTASGVTGQDGSYDLAVPPGSYEVSANGGNKANPSLPLGWYFRVPAIDLEADRTLDLKLPPTVQLTIEALDSKGGPIAEALVGLPTLTRPADLGGASADYLQTRAGLNGHTGADGRVSFTVFGGQAVNSTELGEIVPPNASGYGRLTFKVPFVEGDTTLSYNPPASVHLTGTLRDAAGNPVPGAGIIANSSLGNGTTASGVTGQDGSYDLAVPPGSYEVSANGGNKANPSLPLGWYFRVPAIDLEADRTLDLKLPPTVQLTIEALDSKGGPIAEALVGLPTLTRPADLGGASADYLQTRAGLNGHTGADGRVSFTVFGGQAVNSTELGEIVPPNASGYGRLTFKVPFVEGDTTLSYNPPASVHLTGTLRDAAGNPVPGAGIIANSSLGNGTTASGVTGQDGSYDLAVPPGSYEVSANGGNKANPSLPLGWYFRVPAIDLEADRTLDLKLPPTVQLTIEALDSKGGPIAEALVGLPTLTRPADLGGASADYLQTRAGLNGHTGADGRVSFTVFGGQAVNSTELGEIVPPNASGYGRLTFKVPFVEGDTTLSYQFTEGGEEEPVEDVEGPHLNEFGIEPGPIDTSESDQTVVAYANISDNLSGFVKGAINFRAPNGERFLTTFDFKRVSGNANAGDYQIQATFPQYSEPGTYAIEVIYLYDALFNETAIKEADLKELGWQHTVTVASEEADTEAPMVDELSIEPSTIDTTGTSRTVTVFAHVTDNLAGAKQVGVSFVSPDGNRSYTGWAYKPVAGSPTNGVYEIPVSFQPFSEVGSWRISGIVLSDAAGNSRFLDQGQVGELGLQREVLVEGASDTQGPVLSELSIEPTTVDTSSASETVTVRAHVEDDLSGFTHGNVTFTSPSGTQSTSGTKFERISGTANSGDYLLFVPFKEFSETGPWTISEIRLVDATFNATVLDPGQVVEMGFPNTVSVEAQAPTVTGLNPAFGPEAGGNEIQITGTGFGKGSQVWFGEKQAEATTYGPNLIVAVAPPGAGTVDVTVTSGSATSATSAADRYQYSPPVTITSSPNPSVRGQKVTFTAKVLPQLGGGPAPLGTVAFIEGSSTLAVVNLSKGTATFNTTTLGAGKHPVVARYSGDSHYGPGESEAVTQVVEKAATEVTLSSSFQPAPFGSSGSLKATVKAIAPGAGTPAGTVTFREGETVLATVQMSGSSASLPLKSLPLGEHAVTASYGGDPNFHPSESEPLEQTIARAATALTLTSTLEPAAYGSSGTLKATVDALAPSLATPPGTVTFWEGEEALATVPLSAGVAKYPLKSLPPGSHDIRATYGGTPEFEAAEDSLTQVVTKAATVLSLTSSLNPAPYGSAGTLKATVKAVAPGGGAPSGTVTFREGETVLAVVPLASSVAKYAFKALTPGTHQITATYSGEANYEPSEGAIEQAIDKATTAVTVTSTKNPAPSGSSGSIKATVKALAPGGGTPTGTVTFREGEAVLATLPLSSGSASYPLKGLPPGTHEIVARYNGSSNYEPGEGLIVQTISP